METNNIFSWPYCDYLQLFAYRRIDFKIKVFLRHISLLRQVLVVRKLVVLCNNLMLQTCFLYLVGLNVPSLFISISGEQFNQGYHELFNDQMAKFHDLNTNIHSIGQIKIQTVKVKIP